jgi:hypothetical protein
MIMTKKSKLRGPGRPPKNLQDRKIKQTISISPQHLALARKLGNGQVSVGIAVALDAQAKR